MKKLVAMLLSVSLVLALAACAPSNPGSNPSSNPTTSGTNPTPGPSTPDPVVTPDPSTPGSLKDPDPAGTAAKWTEKQTADGWYEITNEGGATLGYSKASGLQIIQVDGFAFKDLNRNGKLDVYEDWRNSDEDRAWDLANQMSGEEIVPYLTHGGWGTFAADRDTFRSEGSNADGLAYINGGGRGGVTRNMGSNQEANVQHALWVNNIQELCEELDYGLPAMISIDPNGQSGIIQTLSLAATFDPALALEVGKAYSEQYRAAGVAFLLGPQVDVASSPLMQRGSGTYGEDPALSRDIAEGFVSGMQSTWDGNTDLGWGEDSVLCIMKHWVGAGAQEGGRDDHSSEFSVFPGHNFEAQLIPFVDGAFNLKHSITKSAGGIMTNYSVAYDPNNDLGEQVGGAFSAYKYQLLKDAGWDGYIISDWGPIQGGYPGFGGTGSWGRRGDDFTDGERAAEVMELGMNQMGGYGNLEGMADAWAELVDKHGEAEALTIVRGLAYKNIVACMRLNLFENAYCSTAKVRETCCTTDSLAWGLETQLKAVVMLKNSGGVIKAAGADKLTVYVPYIFTPASTSRWGSSPAKLAPCLDLTIVEQYFNVVTDTLKDPSGKDAEGKPAYTANDVTRASAADLAKCDLLLVKMTGPYVAGAEDPNYDQDNDAEYGMYTPTSLQYAPYTASGVRNPSLGGEMVTSTFNDGYTMQTTTKKQNLSYWGKTSAAAGSYSHLELLQYVSGLKTSAPVVVVMGANSSGAMVWSEVEPLADAILYAYSGTTEAAIAQILAGKVEPSALLTHQQPASMQAVEKEKEDVSRDLECYVDADGNTYDFAFGMNWSGVINDSRVQTYSVAPLTKVTNMNFQYAK